MACGKGVGLVLAAVASACASAEVPPAFLLPHPGAAAALHTGAPSPTVTTVVPSPGKSQRAEVAPVETPHQQHAPSVAPAVTFLSVVKMLCMISNVIFQVSPFPEARSWASRGHTGEIEPAPLVSIFFGGTQWCWYGLFAWYFTGKSGFLLLVQANIVGVVCGAYYVVAFFQHCKREKELQGLYQYLRFAGFLVLIQAFSFLLCKTRTVLLFSGFVASGCAILSSASMLVPVPEVIKTQNAASINTPVVVSIAVSALLWLVCGCMLEDANIAVPQTVGLCSAALCLWLKAQYADGTRAKDPLENLRNLPCVAGHEMPDEPCPGDPPIKPGKLKEGFEGTFSYTLGRGYHEYVGTMKEFEGGPMKGEAMEHTPLMSLMGGTGCT